MSEVALDLIGGLHEAVGELAQVVGYVIIVVSLIYFGASVAHALIERWKNRSP